jgi:hypothetical protein
MEPGSLLTLTYLLFKMLIFPNLILKIVIHQKSLGPDYLSINAHPPYIGFTHACFFLCSVEEVSLVQNLVYYVERAYRTPDFGPWGRGESIYNVYFYF